MKDSKVSQTESTKRIECLYQLYNLVTLELLIYNQVFNRILGTIRKNNLAKLLELKKNFKDEFKTAIFKMRGHGTIPSTYSSESLKNKAFRLQLQKILQTESNEVLSEIYKHESKNIERYKLHLSEQWNGKTREVLIKQRFELMQYLADCAN